MNNILDHKIVDVELSNTYVIYKNELYFTSHKIRNFGRKFEKILAVLLINAT